ncbi:MAG: hypothetical protein QNI90_17355 [Dinoroseobacter sp.]|nr:hypothetical protein [Dinoroseobacter sp.]
MKRMVAVLALLVASVIALAIGLSLGLLTSDGSSFGAFALVPFVFFGLPLILIALVMTFNLVWDKWTERRPVFRRYGIAFLLPLFLGALSQALGVRDGLSWGINIATVISASFMSYVGYLLLIGCPRKELSHDR